MDTTAGTDRRRSLADCTRLAAYDARPRACGVAGLCHVAVRTRATSVTNALLLPPGAAPSILADATTSAGGPHPASGGRVGPANGAYGTSGVAVGTGVAVETGVGDGHSLQTLPLPTGVPPLSVHFSA